MAVYVSDLLTAIPAPVDVAPASAQTWQWLRSSTAISGATGGTYTTTLADLGTTLAVTQTETNFLGAASATSANTEVVQAYDPNALFRFSEPGVWFDPNDITTLYKGAIPYSAVTAPGDTVALMLDKSKGLVLGPELVTNGDFSDGTTGWTGFNANLSATSGVLRITSIANGQTGAYSQAITTVAGKVYKFSGTFVTDAANGNTFIGAGTSTTGGQLAFININSVPGSYSFIFTATTSTSYINFFSASAATAGQYIEFDNVSVREIPGNHATQPTLASQPTYGIVPAGGRRNNLLESQQFGTPSWSTGAVVISPDSQIAPDGTLTADTATYAAQFNSINQNVTLAANTYTLSYWLKAGTGTNPLFFGFFNGSWNTGPSATPTSSWVRHSYTFTSALTVTQILIAQDRAASGFGSAYIWGAQLELGSIATPYQRVGTTYDVTEAGVPSLGYLYFDGSGDSMITPTITPNIDKVQVFTGVRKFSDAAQGIFVELSVSTSSNDGTFRMTFPGGSGVASYGWLAKGTLTGSVSSSGFASPITSVVAGSADISGDRTTLRINGTQTGQDTADLGTGNFLAYPLYIGARSGGGLPFNGQLFPLIVRFGTNLTAARITATENWMATQTPLQWTVGSGFWNDAYPWSDISAWRD